MADPNYVDYWKTQRADVVKQHQQSSGGDRDARFVELKEDPNGAGLNWFRMFAFPPGDPMHPFVIDKLTGRPVYTFKHHFLRIGKADMRGATCPRDPHYGNPTAYCRACRFNAAYAPLRGKGVPGLDRARDGSWASIRHAIFVIDRNAETLGPRILPLTGKLLEDASMTWGDSAWGGGNPGGY